MQRGQNISNASITATVTWPLRPVTGEGRRENWRDQRAVSAQRKMSWTSVPGRTPFRKQLVKFTQRRYVTPLVVFTPASATLRLDGLPPRQKEWLKPGFTLLQTPHAFWNKEQTSIEFTENKQSWTSKHWALDWTPFIARQKACFLQDNSKGNPKRLSEERCRGKLSDFRYGLG